jgi:hypothetical protein
MFMIYLHIKLHFPISGGLSVTAIKPKAAAMLFFMQIYTNASENHPVSIFSPEDGDSMFLRNVGIYLHEKQHGGCFRLLPRRRTSTSSPP